MHSYLPFFFALATLMAVSGGFMLYFSWRYVEGVYLTGKTLPIALISGFIFSFTTGILGVLASSLIKSLAIQWFMGNGFYLATFFAMIFIAIQFQLLESFKRQ